MVRTLRQIYRFFNRLVRSGESVSFAGNFASWFEAQKDCTGYDAPNILEKQRIASAMVRDGIAVYERDSVLFGEIQYSFPLLVFLLYVSTANDGSLNLVDFGGALGSTYQQNRAFLNNLKFLKWNIVEQPHFVSVGQSEFSYRPLSFFPTIKEAVSKTGANILLLSSVLPYLEDPIQFLKDSFEHKFEFIIIDRTPILPAGLPRRLTVETVPPEIYEAKYPAWFFNESEILTTMAPEYTLIQAFDSWEKWQLQDVASQSRAYLFARTNEPK